MRQFWSVTIATFLLLGFAGVTLGAAISEKQAEVQDMGGAAMAAPQCSLACTLRR